jgi:hypothetical protein
MQVQEHTLVLQTLEPLDEGRKCFRLVGGVLVEQTVGTARPTVQGNMDNLKLVGLYFRVHVMAMHARHRGAPAACSKQYTLQRIVLGTVRQ